MEDEQAKKFFLAKVIAISIVAVLLIFWFLNLGQVFKGNSAESADSDLQEFKRQLDELVVDAQKNISQFNIASSTASSSPAAEVVTGVAERAGANLVASSSNPVLDIEAAKRAANSLASSSAGGLLEKNELKQAPDCPAYINCMPTIGEARSCVIPAGCEGITEKVY